MGKLAKSLTAVAGSSSLELYEETITSSQTWTAPATTTELVSITGNGQDGTADTGAVFTSANTFPAGIPTYTGGNCFGVNVGASYTSDRNSRLSTFNSQLASVTATSYTLTSFTAGYYMYCTDQAVYLRYISSTNRYVKRISGTVYYRTNTGSTGASTTGFGYSFSGGTPAAPTAPTNTYYSISVTPEGGYPLTIGPGGYLTIRYYA